MTSAATGDTEDVRRVLLTGRDIVGCELDPVLALAWIRLAGQIAPPGAARAHRVTVLTPIWLQSD
jgi:hypothetical protein